jgi:hypothetical protein
MTPGLELIAGAVFKLIAMLFAFVSGVVTATWIVAKKFQTFDARLAYVENDHQRCQGSGGALDRMEQKLDALTQNLEDSIDRKFERVHSRIDEVLQARATLTNSRRNGAA